MHGVPSMGMMGSQIRPGGVPSSAVHQQRPIQAVSGIRPQNASNNMAAVPQNFQGHGILRGSSATPPTSSTPSTSQSQPSPHQPWLSSAPHGRPPLPSQSFRPQGNSQSLQQRSHIPQQSPQPTTSQPQQLSSSQPQQQLFPTLNQSQENPGQQLSSRASQTPANQQQIARGQGIGNQRPPSPAMVQPSIAQSNPADQPGAAEPMESCNRILSKRSIQELVNQIDPSETLDPEVEDVLVDIAEDFIDSVTTFGCSLAKHRKSNTLEAKDILLHLERAWNMTLPGFGGDEIKTYKKPVINDIHRERLAVVKKSIAVGEAVNNKSSAGPASGNAKGSVAKAPPMSLDPN
uniref:Transcription initiation factor TFIID subunit 12 domain-containing protein n=1 Tax=Opuntia streptacantha TaxID=393608 RepID=A0A7C9D701_OPUST